MNLRMAPQASARRYAPPRTLDRPRPTMAYSTRANSGGTALDLVEREQGGASPLATARWTNESETSRLRFKIGQYWLGLDADGNPLGYADDRHICLVSGTRGGKGTSSIINNLLLWPGSIVVVDPKGENATVTAQRRGPGSDYARGLGQSVHVLDPFKVTSTDLPVGRYNPLDAVDPNGPEAVIEASIIADALVVVQDDSKDPYWDLSARSLVRALILYVLTEEAFEGERNLVTVRRLITHGHTIAYEVLQELRRQDSSIDDASPFALLFEDMRRNERFEAISSAGITFGDLLATAPKTFNIAKQVADQHTEFIDSPGMRHCLSASDFSLSELKTDPKGMSLYLSLPRRVMRSHFRWLRMMISLILTEMEKTPGKPKTGHAVLMCLDEFAALRRMQDIENAAAQIAGFGVKLLTVVQDLGQLKDVYKENWQTFLSNSGLKLFFQTDDEFTQTYLSKQIGETELIRETASRSFSRGSSASDSFTKSDSTSDSVTNSSGRTDGTSRGSSTGTNSGYSSGSSGQWGPDGRWNSSSNSSSSGGSTSGSNWGTSTSTNISESRGQTLGTSHSAGKTTGTTEGRTEGASQSIHKTALITTDEIYRMFSRVDDSNDPRYPGLALAFIPGMHPLITRKANYYADPRFFEMFDPHPDFDPPRTIAENAVFQAAELKRLETEEQIRRREEEAAKAKAEEEAAAEAHRRQLREERRQVEAQAWLDAERKRQNGLTAAKIAAEKEFQKTYSAIIRKNGEEHAKAALAMYRHAVEKYPESALLKMGEYAFVDQCSTMIRGALKEAPKDRALSIADAYTLYRKNILGIHCQLGYFAGATFQTRKLSPFEIAFISIRQDYRRVQSMVPIPPLLILLGIPFLAAVMRKGLGLWFLNAWGIVKIGPVTAHHLASFAIAATVMFVLYNKVAKSGFTALLCLILFFAYLILINWAVPF